MGRAVQMCIPVLNYYYCDFFSLLFILYHLDAI